MDILEFQAIVLAAGKGSRMTEILGKRRIKCLLPIGTHPMVWYPLNMLEKAGFNDVMLVVLESSKNEIQLALDKMGMKIHVDVVTIPEDDWGTSDTLRHLEETKRIKSDVVVVSGDLVTDVNLSQVLDIFRRNDATLSSLLFHNESSPSTLVTPGPKNKGIPERDIIGIDPVTNRLVLFSSESDYEGSLSISRRLVQKYGRVKLSSKLLDAHLYVMKHFLLQYLTHNRNISTIKGELIPYVVRKQNTKPSVNKPETDKAPSLLENHSKTDIREFVQRSTLRNKIQNMSSFNDHRGDEKPAYHNDAIKCYACIAPQTSFGTRVNTVVEYCRINREIIQRWPSITHDKELVKVSPDCKILSSQVDRETSLIGHGTDIAEKISIKSSNIGCNVTVKPKTRVVNCIIMNGVAIGEGCALNNCVISDGSEIGDNCDLKDCLVNGTNVAAGEKISKEVLSTVETGFCYFD